MLRAFVVHAAARDFGRGTEARRTDRRKRRKHMSTPSTAATQAPSLDARPLLVRHAAVLGAGTMGSRIAAHLANAGIPTLLLDLAPRPGGTERPLAQTALEALKKAKPAAFFEPSLARLITPEDFDED